MKAPRADIKMSIGPESWNLFEKKESIIVTEGLEGEEEMLIDPFRKGSTELLDKIWSTPCC